MSTLLQELVDGASGDTVPVATLLRKVKVLAARVKTGELADWVEHELVGYPEDADLPDYRGPFAAEVKGHFAGPFGSGYQNAPIPSIGFPSDFREDALFKISFPQAISELEQLAKASKSLRAEWPADAVAYTNTLIQQGDVTLYEGMGLQQAWREISPAHVGAVVDAVRTRILDLALSLEGVAPSAGQPGGDVPSRDVIGQIVTNVYGGNPNIAVASSDVHQQVTLPAPGDVQALLAVLSQAGFARNELDALEEALAADAEEGNSGEMGPRAGAWLGRVAARSAATAGAIGIGAAGDLAARAIAAYFGLA